MSERPGEMGCGAHVGWIAVNGTTALSRSLVASHAVACDIVAPFKIFELRSEVYGGQALRGLGGGAIGQVNASGAPVHDVGGWAQLNVAPSPIWSVGAGFGMDDPRDSDLAATARLRNAAGALYVITHPSGPLLISAEVRRIATSYTGKKLFNDHFNLGFGFEF